MRGAARGTETSADALRPMTIDPERLERGLRFFADAVQTDPELLAEFEASRADFLAEGQSADPDEALRAARRHLEWFLFERESAQLGGLPVQELLPAWRERASAEAPELLEREEAWLATHAGIFEVSSVDEGVGAWLHDLAGLGEFAIGDETGSRVYRAGDLIVGRLYPTDEVRFTLSPVAGFYRNDSLRDALRRDLQRQRDARDRRVLRLSQLELERMFWAPQAGGAPTDPVGDARRFLTAGGLDGRTIEGIFARLSGVPFDPDAVVHGGDDVLGEVLDALAFDTQLDLDAARRLLLHAWASLAAPRPAADAPAGDAKGAGEADVRAAMAEFDADRARGLGVEESFAELERRLGLDDLGDDEDDAPAPDFPGAVAAVVEEFLWERAASGEAESERASDLLRLLGRYGESVGVFENLGGRDLLVFASWWVLEHGDLRDADDAVALLDVLERFCAWAESEHEVALHTDFAARIASLRETLPRAVEAARRHADDAAGDTGELYEFVSAISGGRATVRDRSGDEPSLALGPLAEELERGDLLRARRGDDDALRVYCVYPPEAAELTRDASGR